MFKRDYYSRHRKNKMLERKYFPFLIVLLKDSNGKLNSLIPKSRRPKSLRKMMNKP